MRTDVAILQAPTTEHAQSQKGNVIVEFAIILPLFLLLLFGVISFSIALYNKTVLTMATRQGARVGVVYVTGRTNTTAANTARTNALQVCQNDLITFGSGTPTVTASVDVNNNLTVIANITYNGLYIFSSNLPISAQTTMRLE